MSNRFRIKISITIKIFIIGLVLMSLLLGCFYGNMKGITNFLYFTIQSNIWIALIDIIFLFFLFKKLRKPNFLINDKLYIIHQVFTISISLTGIVFCVILMPAFFLAKKDLGPLDPSFISSILFHSVIPILAIIDFICFSRNYIFSKKDGYWAIIPPIYYLCFSLFGYFFHWEFVDELNYPYFFLNYDSPARIFGFSNEMPYFMGSFYWMILIILIVLGCSLLFNKIVNHLTIKLKNEM